MEEITDALSVAEDIYSEEASLWFLRGFLHQLWGRYRFSAAMGLGIYVLITVGCLCCCCCCCYCCFREGRRRRTSPEDLEAGSEAADAAAVVPAAAELPLVDFGGPAAVQLIPSQPSGAAPVLPSTRGGGGGGHYAAMGAGFRAAKNRVSTFYTGRRWGSEELPMATFHEPSSRRPQRSAPKVPKPFANAPAVPPIPDHGRASLARHRGPTFAATAAGREEESLF